MIYLDNHATTACDPLVVDAMMPFFSGSYGNSSSPHEFGQAAAAAVSQAKEQVAALLGADPGEIVFTSGATESNNIALLGATQQHKNLGGTRRRLVTTATEHKSIVAPLQYLAQQGWELVYLPVDRTGRVDLIEAKRLITLDTLLVSVQAANSEIGTIQPVAALADLAHANGALFHCDACQAVGKINLQVDSWRFDLLSLSAHKLYGPKGVGAVWIRGGEKQLPLVPLMYGGAIGSLRPGTLPVPLLIGFGKACEVASHLLAQESQRIGALRDSFEHNLLTALPEVTVNGALTERLPNNSSLTFGGLEAEVLLANLPDIVASTGSACESGSIEPSRVLLTIGLTREQAFSTIRFGLGRFTTEAEIRAATAQLIATYREVSMWLA
ncbi:cysteine desulfurase family protein [Spirosoma radiotolerans]|uniref:cysteine desulfurase n=1 Tax=Spirosoma radiotolerans TaxID=1379870 RepID=A0A0E3V9A0_9BACT|nr:cysteine desulfurase family protein [Spirosoma radiotolerans]AKD56961.1 hypothetical protein SD10_20695 [Spirosoma radiotolerans]